MDPLYLWFVVAALIIVGGGVVHVIEWRLYVSTRIERDMARETLAAMTADRDGWRGVAERALLVAQIGKRVTARATTAAQIVVEDMEQ